MAALLDPIKAAAVLLRGGVIAYPTEAVWGLGCDPFDESAVLRLLALKQRPVDKGLILIAASLAQFDGMLDWDALTTDAIAAVRTTWPGPHTWLLPTRARVPKWITGMHDTVAVRVSAHPQVVALCVAFGGPLVSTSANLAGAAPVRLQSGLDPMLLTQLDAIVQGSTGALAQPTAIRDARTGVVLRGN